MAASEPNTNASVNQLSPSTAHEQLPLSDCHAGLPENAQLLPTYHTLGWHSHQSFISLQKNKTKKVTLLTKALDIVHEASVLLI